MVFSFFKKPPQKMVARPAAAPRRPDEPSTPPPEAAPASVAAEAPPPPKELAPLEFAAAASDFSDLSEFPGDIHVESDIDPVQSDIEQVAVLYANGQDAAVRAMLESAVQVHRHGPGERLWLMLFDFYRLNGQAPAFEALSLDFATAFEKSPPAWREASVQAVGGAAGVSGKTAAGTVLFQGDLTGENDAAFATLDEALARHPRLRLELVRVAAVDDLGCERLLGVLAAARKRRKDIELVGRDVLAALLEARIADGRRSDAGCWLLLLELYQLMGRQEAFEDKAIEYAVTFEMSPPSWEAQRVAAAEPAPVLALVDSEAAPAADDGFVLRGDLKAERFPQLADFAARHDPVVLDFAAVKRIDFVSAGTLVNLLTPIKRAGKRVLIRHPNHLVVELLGVVGLKAVAEVELAKT